MEGTSKMLKSLESLMFNKNTGFVGGVKTSNSRFDDLVSGFSMMSLKQHPVQKKVVKKKKGPKAKKIAIKNRMVVEDFDKDLNFIIRSFKKTSKGDVKAKSKKTPQEGVRRSTRVKVQPKRFNPAKPLKSKSSAKKNDPKSSSKNKSPKSSSKSKSPKTNSHSSSRMSF